MNENLRLFVDSVADCIEVPHEWLPIEFRDKRRKTHTSLRYVKRKLRKKKLVESEHQEKKSIKAKNIENYKAQIEAGQESIEYNENGPKLHRNCLTFCKLMVESGLMQEEEFTNE